MYYRSLYINRNIGSLRILIPVTEFISFQILDNKATAVTAAMDAMKSDCEEVIMRDPTTWKPGPDGKPEPPTAVSDEICPNQCSKNGKCVKGKCVCIAGFLSEDCSVKKGNY